MTSIHRFIVFDYHGQHLLASASSLSRCVAWRDREVPEWDDATVPILDLNSDSLLDTQPMIAGAVAAAIRYEEETGRCPWEDLQ